MGIRGDPVRISLSDLSGGRVVGARKEGGRGASSGNRSGIRGWMPAVLFLQLGLLDVVCPQLKREASPGGITGRLRGSSIVLFQDTLFSCFMIL